MVSLRNIFITAICITVTQSCNFQSSTTTEQAPNNSLTLTQSEIEDTAQLQSYWQEIQFTEDEIAQQADKIEEVLFVYISQFPNYSNNTLQASVQSLIKKSQASPAFYKFLKEKFEHYLYHPNSPIRNDIYFEQVLNSYLQSTSASSEDQIRDQALLELVKLNQKGTEANDFTFIDINNVEYKLHSQESKYKLLIFYDPKCKHCKETLRDMKESTLLQQAMDSKSTTVIAIDPTGDYKAWEQHQSSLPKNWIIGFDKEQQIIKIPLYNILGYPTIYLLDINNTILLKDPSFFQIEEFLLLNN